MADALTSQVIQDGGRTAVLKFTNVSDGTGQSEAVLVDVSSLSADPVTKQACTGVTLQKITFSNIGMGVELLWDATTNTICWDLNSDYTTDEDFTEFGGIRNTSGSGKTGDILLTTTGHSSGDSYVIVLTLDKEF